MEKHTEKWYELVRQALKYMESDPTKPAKLIDWADRIDGPGREASFRTS